MSNITCPHCKKILQENFEGLKNQKYFQCCYCGNILSNPYFIEADKNKNSYIG